MFWEHDYEGARAAFLRGLELTPNNTQGRCWYALFFLIWLCDKRAEGLAEARIAYERDPLSAYAATILSLALSMNGETGEGLAFARLAVDRDPDGFVYHWIQSLAAHWHGAFDESLAASARAADVSGRHHFLAHRAIALADCGRLIEARALHDELLAKRARQYVPNFSLAVSASAIGEMDAAIEYAQQGCDEREPIMVILTRVIPDARRLRADPRFADIFRRLGFHTLA
jgi:tetratricopeptide (TPR) repeat protein